MFSIFATLWHAYISRCPYCDSTNITAARGHWECYDCGREGSY